MPKGTGFWYPARCIVLHTVAKKVNGLEGAKYVYISFVDRHYAGPQVHCFEQNPWRAPTERQTDTNKCIISLLHG